MSKEKKNLTALSEMRIKIMKRLYVLGAVAVLFIMPLLVFGLTDSRGSNRDEGVLLTMMMVTTVTVLIGVVIFVVAPSLMEYQFEKKEQEEDLDMFP